MYLASFTVIELLLVSLIAGSLLALLCIDHCRIIPAGLLGTEVLTLPNSSYLVWELEVVEARQPRTYKLGRLNYARMWQSFVVMEFVGAPQDGGVRRRLVIWRDSLSPEEFARLRRYLVAHLSMEERGAY